MKGLMNSLKTVDFQNVNWGDLAKGFAGDYYDLMEAIKDGNKKDICRLSGKIGAELAAGFATGGGAAVKKVRDLLSSLNKAMGPMVGKCKFIGKTCFVSGTMILTGSEAMVPIEDIAVGDRVLTAAKGAEQNSETIVDQKTWKLYKLQMPDLQNPDDIFQINILRPQDWLKAEKLEGYVWMEIEELNLEGFAKILEIADCPPIAEGPGRVVTMTVNHDNHFVYHLTFGPRGPPLKVTGYHPLYSETRGDWVKVKYLEEGEELRTFDGIRTVVKKKRVPGRFKVFNLEVEAEHRYYAGEQRVLAHNSKTETCTTNGSHDPVDPNDEALLDEVDFSEGSAPEITEGTYEFPDQRDGGDYVGQSEDIPRRLGEHEAAGRYIPGTEKRTEVLGNKTKREIAEHETNQEKTGGVHPSKSDKVSNKVNPIGEDRKDLL